MPSADKLRAVSALAGSIVCRPRPDAVGAARERLRCSAALAERLERTRLALRILETAGS